MRGTKDRILEVAAEDFALYGYHAATIRGICSKAGVNVAAVNYHFSSKGQLYEKVFEYLFEQTDGDWLDVVGGEPRGESEWYDRIEVIVGRMLEKCTSSDRNERNLLKLLAYEELNPSESFPAVYEKFLAPRLEALRDLLSYGDIRTSEDLSICVLGVVSLGLMFADKRSLVGHFTGNRDFGSDNLDLIVGNLMAGIKASIKYSGRKGDLLR